MGKMIEQFAKKQNHEVVAIVDEGQFWPKFSEDQKPDVAIEFTQPNAVEDNIKQCIDWNIPVVVGTTGWDSRRDDLRSYCLQKNGSVVFGSNFSIGVNIWFLILKTAAENIAKNNDYSVKMTEIHHVAKKDKPSGTAITAANILLKDIKQYNGWSLSEEPDKILIDALRKEDVAGVHSVLFKSALDEIEITHRAGNREGFAKGALAAAEWLVGKKGFFEFADIFKMVFEKNK